MRLLATPESTARVCESPVPAIGQARRSESIGRIAACVPVLICVTALTGCRATSSAERYGKTFFLDGAGNWGDGGEGVARGLFAAGFQGDVEEYVWTTSYNPLVDQLNQPAARARAATLARKIEAYREAYPNTPLNLVALSAGTGVATWALEILSDGTEIDNFVMLGSSLSADYDMSVALSHIGGKIYVYYSPHDVVLETVRTIGTIDGKRGVDSAGYVGLQAPPGQEDRVINTEWSRDWLQYGWTGAHQDCVNATFVRFEIAKHLLPTPPGSGIIALQGAGATPPIYLFRAN